MRLWGQTRRMATPMDASNQTTTRKRQEGAARATYEAPVLTTIGPMSQFTFGSKNNGNDGINTKKN
jgi:hypothetical protein